MYTVLSNTLGVVVEHEKPEAIARAAGACGLIIDHDGLTGICTLNKSMWDSLGPDAQVFFVKTVQWVQDMTFDSGLRVHPVSIVPVNDDRAEEPEETTPAPVLKPKRRTKPKPKPAPVPTPKPKPKPAPVPTPKPKPATSPKRKPTSAKSRVAKARSKRSK
jgi:outer membrane biosynthesis protein TonB